MNELTYTRCGDYYIPDLKLSEQPEEMCIRDSLQIVTPQAAHVLDDDGLYTPCLHLLHIQPKTDVRGFCPPEWAAQPYALYR